MTSKEKESTGKGPTALHYSTTIITQKHTSSESNILDRAITRFSNLTALARAMSRVRRMFHRRQAPDTINTMTPTTSAELHREFLLCAKLSQQQDFKLEIDQLTSNRPVHKNSPLRRLAPFMHSDGLIRVGGRLSNSNLACDEKHPVILNGTSHLAHLVIQWAHQRSLHGGFRSTYIYALRRAWIVGGRSKVRSIVRKCVVCTIADPRPASQAMAALPAVRVTPAPAFSRTGVDYAGPFSILRSKERGIRCSKGYVAVFVCLVTKAIRLE